MSKLYNRVKVSTSTSGTGTITLGSAVRDSTNGDFLTFAEAGVADGETVSYFIQDGANFAYGEGVYTASGTTLSRDDGEMRWNGSAHSQALLSLSGSAKVYITARALDVQSGSASRVKVLKPVQWFWVNPDFTAMPAWTYANGTGGVGATITANANGAISTYLTALDPQGDVLDTAKLFGEPASISVGDRVLFIDYVPWPSHGSGGIYTVTDLGSAGTPWVLTRATDANTDAASQFSLSVDLEGTRWFAKSAIIDSVIGSGATQSFDNGHVFWAVGSSTGFAAGARTAAMQRSSFAIGENATASAQYATAIGALARASGQGSTALNNSVAYGNRSLATGGGYASGTYAVALGAGSYATGQQSTAIGVYANAATYTSGDYSVAIGANASASGAASTAIGKSCTADAAWASATGVNSNAYGVKGVAVRAASTPASATLVQTGTYHLAIGTTNATPAVMVVDGAAAGTANQVVLGNNTTFFFRAMIVARRTDATGGNAAYTLEGCITRDANAASTALVGTPVKTVFAETNAAWDVDATADTTNGALAITVTGEAAKTIQWFAVVDTAQVRQ